MKEFKTTETLMYEFLVKELETELEESHQRVKILLLQQDLDNAQLELQTCHKLKHKLFSLKEFLEESKLKKCNRNSVIELYLINGNNDKVLEEVLASQEYKPNIKYTDLKLKDWEQLEEGKIYTIGNLSFRRVGDELHSKYKYERVWVVENVNGKMNNQLIKWYSDGYFAMVK